MLLFLAKLNFCLLPNKNKHMHHGESHNHMSSVMHDACLLSDIEMGGCVCKSSRHKPDDRVLAEAWTILLIVHT
jgi:hypothetical protein